MQIATAMNDLRAGWAALRGDWVFWASGAVLVLAMAPYFVPVFDDPMLFDWGWIYADIPVSLVTLLAVSWGLWRLPSPTERHFWGLVGIAYGIGLVIEVGNAFVPPSVLNATVELLLTSGYLAYYLALTLAAAVSRRGAATRGVWRLYWIRSIGLGVIAMGFLVYFELVPFQADPSGPDLWYPGLFLYAALDLVVCIVFVQLARRHDDVRWRGILYGMAAVSALHTVLDTAEAVLYLEPFASMVLAPRWDLAWYLPEFAIVLVARRYLADPRSPASPVRLSIDEPPTDRGTLMVGLLTLPVLHAGLYYFGVLNAELRSMREGVVAAFLLVMGLVATWYFRTLERERVRRGAALKLSEERYRSFVRARSDAVYRAEAEPPIPIADPLESQMEAIQGRMWIAEVAHDEGDGPEPGSPGGLDVLGRPFVELVPEGARDRLLRRWISEDYQVDSEVFERDGEGGPRYFRLSLTGVVSDGALRRAWVTRSDVTEQRMTALENERLGRELEQARKMESLGTLAGGIAHDFNNLLVPIMGFSELALMHLGRDDDEVRAGLGQIHKASLIAADLVDQILAVSRDHPRREIPFLLQDTVRDTLDLLRTGLSRGIELDVSISDACPPVLGDPSRVHQVVMNLCTNAAQAIGSREGRIAVRVEHDPEVDVDLAPRGWVVLRVEDDGPGMEPALVRRAFDPFFTTKDAGKGTGLGLAVVHGIVMSHGGRVTLDSVPSGGTEVVVRIPATETRPARIEAGGAFERGPLSILVVDDEAPVAAVTRKVLESAGHRVRVAHDGETALSILSECEWSFDALITDYAMPGISGAELATTVRGQWPDIAVVLSSGYLFHDPVDLKNSVRLKKPFTAAQLATALNQAIGS